jgi:kynurenine formamidase
MIDRRPTREEVIAYLRANRNWGRWPDAPERGAANLITPGRIAAAAATVRDGVTISLGREFPTEPGRDNEKPAQHHVMGPVHRRGGGMVLDYIGTACHGMASTHIDALCHVWDQDGMWEGRTPEDTVSFEGMQWGGIEHWSDGLVTRAVLFDVPAFRGTGHVTQDEPVHGWELAEIAAKNGVTVAPGDAIVVYSGREDWEEHRPATPPRGGGRGLISGQPRPGLDASCLWYLRETDAAVLVWDMLDMIPNGYDMAWGVHSAIWAFGVALIDNALLAPLAAYCRSRRRADFMLTAAPLRIVGGTGSPVNPVAVL